MDNNARRHEAQIELDRIGPVGQERLANAHILIVGVGALGSVAAELLCRAGVKHLTLCDFDIVQESNLQRQALYTTSDIGKQKVDAARAHLLDIDPTCCIEAIDEPFSATSPREWSRTHPEYSLIIDGTDSLAARMLLNDTARKFKMPLIIGTASGTNGMMFVVERKDNACWQCVTHGKTASDDCSSGVLNAATHAIACLQVAAAIKIIIDCDYSNNESIDEQKHPDTATLVQLDLWNTTMRKIIVARNPSCRACLGEYRYLDEQRMTHALPALRFCQSRTHIQATPTVPTLINLERVRTAYKGDILKDYATAILLKVGDGTALVHRHGMIEFSSVQTECASAFTQDIHAMR